MAKGEQTKMDNVSFLVEFDNQSNYQSASYSVANGEEYGYPYSVANACKKVGDLKYERIPHTLRIHGEHVPECVLDFYRSLPGFVRIYPEE